MSKFIKNVYQTEPVISMGYVLTLLRMWSKLMIKSSHLAQDGSLGHWTRMLCGEVVHVAIQTPTYLDHEGVCLLAFLRFVPQNPLADQ